MHCILDSEYHKIIHSSAFKAWFGDWENDPEHSSKVVDTDGKPLICYHGSPFSGITEFKKEKGIRSSGFGGHEANVAAIFFSYDKKTAQFFAENKSEYWEGKRIKTTPTVYPCFLKILKIADFTDINTADRILTDIEVDPYNEIFGMNYPGIDTLSYYLSDSESDLKMTDLWVLVDNVDIVNKLKQKGYDGAKFLEPHGNGDSIAIFESSQAKLADGSNTTFVGDSLARGGKFVNQRMKFPKHYKSQEGKYGHSEKSASMEPTNQQASVATSILNTVEGSPATENIELQNPELQANDYIPQSDVCDTLQTVVPPSMRHEMHKALETVDRRVNGVDEYVAEKLGFIQGKCSIEERKEGLKCLCDAFGAEQVDAIATAIYNIENKNQGLIVGDATGIGKGRIAAAIIRYAIVRGKQPIFLTEKDNLFTDMFRDLIDIGSDDAIPQEYFSEFVEVKKTSISPEELDESDGSIEPDDDTDDDSQDEINSEYFKQETFVANKNYSSDIRGKRLAKPFIVNGRTKKTHIKDKNGNILYKGLSAKETKNIITDQKVPKEYKVILATYSQFNKSLMTPKKEFLMALARNNIVIMDESHNASGDSNTGAFLRTAIESSLGVCFLSATFAKRPDNMPIYAAKTAIADANLSNERLIAAIENGGVALQEVVSSQLVSEGQMIRRERSFEGVEVNYIYLDESQEEIGMPQFNKSEEHRAVFDKVTRIIRDIIEFQRIYVKNWLKALDKQLKAEQGQAEQRKGTKDSGVSNPPEFNGIFNIISQLLFSLKAEAVAERTIARLKQGIKPVVAFGSTMESFLDNITDDSGELIKMGDVIHSDFSEVLKKRLDGVLRYTAEDAMGQKDYKSITRMEMDADFGAAYDVIAADIKKTVTGISISPVDVVRQKIEEAGFSVAEVTGRKKILKLRKGSTAMVMQRPQITATDAFRKFNNNEVDCLMINRSGSTGASAHAIATDKVKRDQVKRRCMIILQAELDINTEVQKRGRINRTGQIYKPIYDYVVSAIPAEQRLMMMLQKKLKSLDANTTSNQKQSRKVLDIPDFLNKYGDEEVIQYLKENEDINKLIDNPLKIDDNGEVDNTVNAAHKVSGRIAILSIKDQENFYNEMTERYNSAVELKRQTDEYDLEVENYNLDAETISKEVIAEGKEGATSVFGRNTILEKCRVNVLKKPYTGTELRALLDAELDGGKAEDKQQALLKEFTSFLNDAHERERTDIENKFFKLEEGITKEKGYLKLTSKSERENYIEQRKEQIEEGKLVALKKEETIFTNKREHMGKIFQFLSIGKVIGYPSPSYGTDSSWYKGVFIGFDIKKTLKNPYTPSAVKLKIALANSMKYVAVPCSKFEIVTGIKALTYENIMSYEEEEILDNWDEITKDSTGNREVRYIITGNILQGYGKLQQKAKLISYTVQGGGVKKGILLPVGFDPAGSGRDTPPLKVTVSILKALPIIKSMLEGRSIMTSDYLSIQKRKDTYLISVPIKRITGGKFYEDKILMSLTVEKLFNKSSSQMIANVEARKIDNVVKYLQDEFKSTVELNQTEYKLIGGDKAETEYEDEINYDRGKEVIEKITAREREEEVRRQREQFETDERESSEERLMPLRMKLSLLRKALSGEVMAGGGRIPENLTDKMVYDEAVKTKELLNDELSTLYARHDFAVMSNNNALLTKTHNEIKAIQASEKAIDEIISKYGKMLGKML